MEGGQVLELERQIAEACGTLNVAHARLVALIATVLKYALEGPVRLHHPSVRHHRR